MVQRHLVAIANPCWALRVFLRVRENLPEGFGHIGASAMLNFLSRGDLLCRLRNLRRWSPAEPQPRSACVRLWRRDFTFPRRARSGGSGCPQWRALGPQSLPLRSQAHLTRRVRKRRPTRHPAKRRARGGCCRARFETGTYHFEALPDFSSAGFRKTLRRLLDILGGVGGASTSRKVGNGGPRSSGGREPDRENVGLLVSRSNSDGFRCRKEDDGRLQRGA